MDTEKSRELQKKIRDGKPASDEGPYYHHAWWESYKGSVKGKFLGVVLGVIGGAAVGGVMVAAASFIGPLAALGGAAAWATVGAFSVAGMTYATHEFSEIGKGVGNTAAQFYQHEMREKTMLKAETAELKEEINELKSLIKGEAPRKDPKNLEAIAAAKEQETSYRKSHYAKLKPEKINTFAFWKVALIGLVVGAAVGALIASGGGAAVILGHIVGEEIVSHMAASSIMAISVATFGAMGATFGFNRDFARKVADKTDLWFKGVFHPKSHALVREQQVKIGLDIEERTKSEAANIATAVLPEGSGIEYPKSETHFRDKVLPAAQRALLSFDHTRATPQ